MEYIPIDDHLASFSKDELLRENIAGSGTVGEASGNPGEEFRKTVSSTEELLGFVNERPPGTLIIYASSAAVYGNDYHGRIKESFGADSLSNARQSVFKQTFSSFSI